MNNPLSTHRKVSNNPNIKKISTNFTENKKQNSFFSLYPSSTKSYKYINLNYQNNDIKKPKQAHNNGISSISFRQPHSLFANYHTQRDSSLKTNNAKFKLHNLEDKEVKINYKTDQVDNSIVLSDANYKEMIKAKDTEIEKVRSELIKAKEQLINANKKMLLYKIDKKQSLFDLELDIDKTYPMSRTNDIQDCFSSQIHNPNTQASVENLLSSSEQLIKEENRTKNISSIKNQLMMSSAFKSSAEIKTALCQLKKRTQRLLEVNK